MVEQDLSLQLVRCNHNLRTESDVLHGVGVDHADENNIDAVRHVRRAHRRCDPELCRSLHLGGVNIEADNMMTGLDEPAREPLAHQTESNESHPCGRHLVLLTSPIGVCRHREELMALWRSGNLKARL